MLTQEEMLRYGRHFSLQDFGLEGQEKLKSAKVLCVGCGGLAAPVLMYLAASGVGTIGVMDNDAVETSNLQRQLLFNTEDVGVQKVVVAKKKILALNPHLIVQDFPFRLEESNALTVIQDFDIVIDCTDNFYSKYLINDACFEQKKAFVYGSIFQFEGQLSFFDGCSSPCFRCLFPEPPAPGMVSNCAEEGVLGVLPGLIGTLQALEAIKWIVGIGENLKGKLFFFDTLRVSAQPLEFFPSEDCAICQKHQAFHSLPRPSNTPCNFQKLQSISAYDLKPIIENVVLIDVREAYEREICHIGGKSIPLNDLELAIQELDPNKRTVLYCKSGQRSQKALKMLVAAGFSQVSFLEGGILEWINQINPDLTRY